MIIYALLIACAFALVIFLGWKIFVSVSNGTNKESKIVDGLADRYKEKKEYETVQKLHTQGPLGITQGSTIKLGGNVMMKLLDEARSVTLDTDTFKVAAIGTLSFLGIKVVRVYLDDDSTFLQFALSRNGDIQNGNIYRRVLLNTIASEQELDFFINPMDGRIGYKTLSLASDAGDVVFDRITPPFTGKNDREEPVSALEEIIDDAGDKITAKLQIAMYERHNGDKFSELAMIQYSSGESEDIETFVGIDLEDESDFTVTK